MITQILTCDNCYKTSATAAYVHETDFPREGTWLSWHCPRCNQAREWLIPKGQSIEDAARKSRRVSPAFKRLGNRDDVYQKLKDTDTEVQRLILFGELVWWWREEVGMTQIAAAKKAGLSNRHWKRIEDGKIKLHDRNIERVVHAVEGSMEQAYLLLKPGKRWSVKFEQRLARAEKEIKSPYFQKLHKDEVLPPDVSYELDIALRELGRVLTVEEAEERFLFYALIIHQTYWNKLLSGPLIIDDHKAELIPVIKKLIDYLKKSEKRSNKYRIVNLIMQEAEYYMTKPLILDLVTNFIRDSFTSVVRREAVWNALMKEHGSLSSEGKLILALFDLVKPEHQSTLLKACKQIQAFHARESVNKENT